MLTLTKSGLEMLPNFSLSCGKRRARTARRQSGANSIRISNSSWSEEQRRCSQPRKRRQKVTTVGQTLTTTRKEFATLGEPLISRCCGAAMHSLGSPLSKAQHVEDSSCCATMSRLIATQPTRLEPRYSREEPHQMIWTHNCGYEERPAGEHVARRTTSWQDQDSGWAPSWNMGSRPDANDDAGTGQLLRAFRSSSTKQKEEAMGSRGGR